MSEKKLTKSPYKMKKLLKLIIKGTPRKRILKIVDDLRREQKYWIDERRDLQVEVLYDCAQDGELFLIHRHPNVRKIQHCDFRIELCERQWKRLFCKFSPMAPYTTWYEEWYEKTQEARSNNSGL